MRKKCPLTVNLLYDIAENGHFVLLILLGNPILFRNFPFLKTVCLLLKLFDFQFASGERTEKETIAILVNIRLHIRISFFFSRPRPFSFSPTEESVMIHRLIRESSRRLGKRKKDLDNDMMTFLRGARKGG